MITQPTTHHHPQTRREPLTVAIIDLMSTRDSWRGTWGELYQVLTDIAIRMGLSINRLRTWPVNTQVMSSRLSRQESYLYNHGIEFKTHRYKWGKEIRIIRFGRTTEVDHMSLMIY
jgi:hypothetical protein